LCGKLVVCNAASIIKTKKGLLVRAAQAALPRHGHTSLIEGRGILDCV
jgi:hypothetical protein